MADEIVINIKNNVITSSPDNPSQKSEAYTQTPAQTGTGAGTKDNAVLGLKAQWWLGKGVQVANTLGFDTSAISKLSHYGFSVAKAIGGLATGNYKDAINLAFEVSLNLLQMYLDVQKDIASQENSIDEARIQMGVLDVSGKAAKVNRFTGRVTYGRYK